MEDSKEDNLVDNKAATQASNSNSSHKMEDSREDNLEVSKVGLTVIPKNDHNSNSSHKMEDSKVDSTVTPKNNPNSLSTPVASI
jgi:hypothetical protein